MSSEPYPIERVPQAGHPNSDDPAEYRYGTDQAVRIFEEGVPVPPLGNYRVYAATQVPEATNQEIKRVLCGTQGGACNACGANPPCDSGPKQMRPCAVAIVNDYSILADRIKPPTGSPVASMPTFPPTADVEAELQRFYIEEELVPPVVFQLFLIDAPTEPLIHNKLMAIPVPPGPA